MLHAYTISFKNIFLFIMSFYFFHYSFAQANEDISLKISVSPSTPMYSGETGEMTFEITNHGEENIVYSAGGDWQVRQADGQMSYGRLEFHENYYLGNCLLGSLDVEPPPRPSPLWWIELRNLKAGETEVCKIKFRVPKDISNSSITFSASIDSGFIDDTNPENNIDTIQINIKSAPRAVPALSLTGLLALLSLLTLVASRRR